MPIRSHDIRRVLPKPYSRGYRSTLNTRLKGLYMFNNLIDLTLVSAALLAVSVGVNVLFL
jgi:hypothetical protein